MPLEQVTFSAHREAPRDANRRGHGTEGEASMQDENTPRGYCQCGCGEKTRLAVRTQRSFGWVKGEPMRFVFGHNRRKPPSYTVDQATGCWVWNHTLNSDGYGGIQRDGRYMGAHIWSWERTHGPVAEGMELDHRCRNRACVNPAHLEPLSHIVNVQRGASSHLTPEQARDVGERRRAGENARALAKEFGVSREHVYRIARGECWPNLTEEAA